MNRTHLKTLPLTELTELYNDAGSYIKFGNLFGVPGTSAEAILKQRGFVSSRKKQIYKISTVKKCVDMYLTQEMTLKQVADANGVKYARTIKFWVAQHRKQHKMHILQLIAELLAFEGQAISPRDKDLRIRAAKALSSKYQVWEGDKCPVSDSTMVEVIERSGKKLTDVASHFDWVHDGISTETDVIAWRLSQQE